MGMSASQARFLSLTARKTNVEYEGQQINQQRTALSNESANYYSQLTSMSVPVPPSTEDYSKITYTFENGTETNTVTSLVATTETKNTGVYMLNYVQQIPEDNMIVNGTSVITRTGDEDNYEYFIGSKNLQPAMSEEPGSYAEGKITDDDKERLVKAGIPTEVVNGYSNKMIADKLNEEAQYRALAAEKYSSEDWFVMYRQNSSTKSYDPVLFSEKELTNTDYNDKNGQSLSGIKQYVFGETTASKEIKNAKAKVEQDSTGRYISLFIYDDYDKDPNAGTKYDLTTTTESDDAAYNDAMNQYYYDKAQYDKQVQEVNAKIEIIQVQDKNLELKLKQLDTEQNAISTEMDAVKKVISKNVESSFKTFNA